MTEQLGGKSDTEVPEGDPSSWSDRGRWSPLRVLFRKVTWLYRGLRWRVIGIFRKITWLYRGLRWRVIGIFRKITWLYRGLRWRVIGRSRKFYWSALRQRRRTLRRLHPLTSRTRFATDLVAVGARRHIVPIARLAKHKRPDEPPLASLKARREIRRRSSAQFDELTDWIPGSRRGPASVRRARTASRLFRPLPVPVNIAFQSAMVEGPIDWKADAKRIANARFIVVSDDVKLDTLVSLIPALLAGRPIATRREAVARVEFGTCSFLAIDLLEACKSNENDLARAAMAQLRDLFGVRSVAGAARPNVSVVLATNRPENVSHAVRQIKAQKLIDVELLVGMHGFAEHEAGDVVFEEGAVRSVQLIELPSEMVFGDVLRHLSERATTSIISKWDDDDLYGPHHLVDLWLLLNLSRAPLVGKAAEFVLLDQNDLLIRRRGGPINATSRFLAGGALMMSAHALDEIGGWGSVPRSVDQELISRFERNGFRTFRIHGYEFVLVRHGRGHTWEADDEYFVAAADGAWSASAVDQVGLNDGSGLAGSCSTQLVERPRDADSQAVTVCVPNRDGADSIRLWEQRCRPWPVSMNLVVCDDRSDPPLQFEGEFETGAIVRAPDGFGFGAGRARRAAASHARGDVLFFVDADMDVNEQVFDEISSWFLEGFVGAVHAHLDFSSIDPSEAVRIVEQSGLAGLRRQFTSTSIPGQEWRERYWAGSGDLTEPQSTSFRATVGAFIAVDSATYARTGGFRDVDVPGVEDIEFGYRLLASGCEQRVFRGGGITHLGARTFSSALKGAEGVARDCRLSSMVPIWSPSLEERQAAISGWEGDVAPVVLVDGADAICQEVNMKLGRGTAFVGPWDGNLVTAPFCIAHDLEPELAHSSIAAAYDAFRTRPCGEVVVMSDGDIVARFFALWAVNLARNRTGIGSAPYNGSPLDAPVTEMIRRRSGIVYTSL
jgi:hypothetical protein